MIVLAPRTRTIIASARGAPGPDGPTGPAGDLARAGNRAALQALTPGGSVLNRWLAESGREGLFQWDASDLSAEVTADTAQALYVPPASDTTGASGAWVRKHDGHWLPEWFGAVGDGASDNRAAFVALAALLTFAGGGIVRFGENKTYRIDQHITAVNGNTFTDMRISGCNGLVIDLNGSKIDIKGDFDRAAATTYGYTGFYLLNCSNVVIRNGEIDGNVDQMTNSSASAEPPQHGIRVDGCTDVLLENVRSHHFPADGLIVQDGGSNGSTRSASKRITLLNSQFVYNARQGLSVIQARGLVAINCDFSFTAADNGAYVGHSPASGVDIEPSYSTASASPNTMDADTGDLRFFGCRIQGNTGATFLCSLSGLIDTVTLRDCTLECADNGTTSGSDGFIADVPGTVIEGCKFNLFSKALYLGWATNAVSSIRFVGNIVRGKSAGLLRSLVNTPSVFVGRNRFIGTHTAGLADFLVQTSNTGLVFEDNYFWIPKEAYVDGGSGDRHIAFNCAAKEFRRNEYATDLPANQGGAATAHYAHQYVGSTIAREEKFTGLAPGTADTFRPIFNEAVFNTTNLYNKLHPGANVPGSITRGNQDSTFLPHTWPTAVIYNTALTADRAVTLSTLAGYVFKGARARIIRTAASTGAFNLNVGTGPLKALATGQWCEVEYDGSAWLLTAAGSL